MPLTDAYKRLLRAKAAAMRSKARRGSSAGLWAGGPVFGVLWLATLLASDSPWWIITGFWIVTALAILWWVQREFRKDAVAASAMAATLDSAVEANRCEIYEVRASRFAEIEEIEDEGACYAFEIAGRSEVVFLHGQEFYPSAKFPSRHFSLVFPLDGNGRRIDIMIDGHAPKAPPDKIIPAARKLMLEIPETLQVIDATLETIEEALRSNG